MIADDGRRRSGHTWDPYIALNDAVRGFVYEVETGRLREVKPVQVSRAVPAGRFSGGVPREEGLLDVALSA
ncbi:hypothetical protein AB0C14_24070 [Microbispora hainanensis]|uniref:hypothetical protein n=1 Tax=Microbispora hainanensis TaxID=568844 RepID=UPI0033FC6213